MTLPKSHIPNITFGKKLPVLVNIHGGSNCVGAGCSPLQDVAGLCAASVEHGKEVICVAINYRLNVFGYGVLPGGEGSNNGLFDQQIALVWVKRHISGFGGDSENITLVGQSSGALSVDAQLHATSPIGRGLFKRAVMQSGCLDIGSPKPREKIIRTTQGLADLVERSNGEKDEGWVEKLRNASVRELISALIKAKVGMWCVSDDGTFFNSPWDQAAGIPDWCESLIIGDCGFEVHPPPPLDKPSPYSSKDLKLIVDNLPRHTYGTPYSHGPRQPESTKPSQEHGHTPRAYSKFTKSRFHLRTPHPPCAPPHSRSSATASLATLHTG